MKLWLPPYLSIRQVKGGIRLGTLPPSAWEVQDPPEFLVDLLATAATPTERASLVGEFVARSGWSEQEASALVGDLQDARVLVPAPSSRDRYDRHRLYYRLMGIDSDAQERLAGVTVGLIGMARRLCRSRISMRNRWPCRPES